MSQVVDGKRCASTHDSGSGYRMHLLASACFVVVLLYDREQDDCLRQYYYSQHFALDEISGYVYGCK